MITRQFAAVVAAFMATTSLASSVARLPLTMTPHGLSWECTGNVTLNNTVYAVVPDTTTTAVTVPGVAASSAFSIGSSSVVATTTSFGNDGRLGLGRPTTNTSGLHGVDSFTVYLAPTQSAVVFNGLDDAYHAQASLTPVLLPLLLLPTPVWTVAMSSLAFEAGAPAAACANTLCPVALNATHPTIQMPRSLLLTMAARYLSTCAMVDGLYVCPTTVALPTLRFTLGDPSTTFLLTPELYTDAGRRRLLLSDGESNEWILGLPFFQRVPITFSIAGRSVTLHCPPGSVRVRPLDAKATTSASSLGNQAPSWAVTLLLVVSVLMLAVSAWFIKAFRDHKVSLQRRFSVESTCLESPSCILVTTP
ncbi:hypothetical protein SPRG_08316 [Saprolegnia parasitica CBS 223.65]|uniref:Peptidase A1 domain-containing protein n=1 Tax=Saprolegnia parasitica (strain CBS 223.65) TaxID=695850 RepID=A0A067CI87_SAPPC|nr:hypothetical protein SPRG_08316 [Saprolegnia parasitica CBS 223.65]KDO26241.1 hypothetical protein SPRG_08316 [Saprolegnia parasitica CBS 223.65]|eukprot:XP_012202950.1 hypothetical protein SPRG_08316 [Saprolegnia parasitica CBS 223.65]